MTRLSTHTRAKALEAGLWQTSKGTLISIYKMPDGHLVNALLKALAAGDPRSITRPLAAEITRRRLQDYAMRVAEERMR